MPIALGAALSIRYRNSSQVVACFFGDAASNQGAFHESINMSAVFSLPVVWICENNRYGLSTSIRKMCPTPCISDKARGYNIPGKTVDGMDVEAVYEAMEEAVKRARKGKGPSLIECETYRFLGHGASDNRSYRTKEEEAEWREKCPIILLKNRLLSSGEMTEDEFRIMEKEVKEKAEDGIKFAEQGVEPEAQDYAKYLYGRCHCPIP